MKLFYFILFTIGVESLRVEFFCSEFYMVLSAHVKLKLGKTSIFHIVGWEQL